MFSAAKDALTSKAALSFINQRIARYGEVERLKLDSKNKSAEIVLRLIGEERPVAVTVERYELVGRDGKLFLRLARCTANREWLQNVLSDFGPGREIPLPPWAASAL
jgi:hypothetical protein